MRVAIHQPNYAPWCGYFAKLRACDQFIFLDDVQVSKGSYTARCQVLGPRGPLWLTAPTYHSITTPIHAVRLASPRWARKHLHTLQTLYGRTAFFAEVYALLAPLYADAGEWLAPFNMRLIERIAAYLGIACRFCRASALQVDGRGDERLIALARAVGADTYVSGAGGQKYQDPGKFAAAGLRLAVRAYQPIPYAQGHPQFVPGLSILDLLFRHGRAALNWLVYPADG